MNRKTRDSLEISAAPRHPAAVKCITPFLFACRFEGKQAGQETQLETDVKATLCGCAQTRMTVYSQLKFRDYERVSAITEIVYTLDLAGYFTFVNREGERLSGYSCEDLKRMHITELVAPEFATCVRNLTQTIRQRVGAVYEVEIITKDQRRIALETSIHLVVREGQPSEIHGIALPPVGNLSSMPTRCLDPNFAFGKIIR